MTCQFVLRRCSVNVNKSTASKPVIFFLHLVFLQYISSAFSTRHTSLVFAQWLFIFPYCVDGLYGTWRKPSATKKDWNLPMPKMANTDLSKLLKSEEIRKVLRAPNRKVAKAVRKTNPLKNIRAMIKLNPYSAVMKKNAELVAAKNIRAKVRFFNIFFYFKFLVFFTHDTKILLQCYSIGYCSVLQEPEDL